MLIPAVCYHSWPSISSSVFPGLGLRTLRLALSHSLGPSVLSPFCWLGTAVMRLGSPTVLAFMKQKGEAGFRLIQKVGVGWEPGTWSTKPLSDSEGDHMQVSLPQRPLSLARVPSMGFAGYSGKATLAVFLTPKGRPSVAPPGSQGPDSSVELPTPNCSAAPTQGLSLWLSVLSAPAL